MIDPKLQRYVRQLNPTQHYLVSEFVENYEDGLLRRRDLLERVLHITGTAAAAAGTLLALGVKPAFADPRASAEFAPPPQTGPTSPLSVPAADPAVSGTDTSFRAGDGATILGYLARPSAGGRYAAVMICHENQGLAEHFKDVARRFAKAGYVALALDMLSRRGGTAAVSENERGSGISGPGAAEQQVADFQAAMAYLRRQPFVDADRIGMIGFCFGGGVTWNVALKEPTLRAAAAFYGNPDAPDELPNLRAAVLGAYGELDARTTSAGLALEPALAAARKTYKLNVYAGAGHAFFNDTRPNTGTFGYTEVAALAAWRDTLAWFNTYLRAGRLPGTGDGSTEEPPSEEGVAGA
jgi:carboxymethylenebutenolidase